MKNRLNKKLSLAFVSLICVLSFVSISACDSYDVEPPQDNQVSVLEGYAIPPGKPITDSERKIIEDRNKEYKIALGINN